MFGRRRILTEVISPVGCYKKKFPVEGNTIVIRPARRGPGGAPYKAEFDRDCLIPYWTGWGPFKKLHQKLLLIEGADKCVSFNFKRDIGEINLPIWDRETEARLFEASVIKAAGATVQKIKIPTSLSIILILLVIMQFISLLLLSGRVRIAR